MEHYKRVTKYWRDSLVDKQFSQGKYNSSDLAKNFLQNNRNIFLRVNSKNVFQCLFSFKNNTVNTIYIPFLYKKTPSHNKNEKDYRPEILLPIMFKVQVSENGFIYPVDKPVIPRDLLSPLDKEDFFIADMDDYDSYVTQNEFPVFELSNASEWEKYYSMNIESQYQKGFLDLLQEKSIIDDRQVQEGFRKITKSLSGDEKKKKVFFDALNKYNEEWSILIEDKLTNDPDFNKAVESYITKWNDYLGCVENLLNRVITCKEVFNGYERIESAYFGNGKLDASSKITALYEDIYTRKDDPDLGLYRNYTTVEEEREMPVIDSDNFFSGRLGHNNNENPLADAQRTAISALLDAEQGEILPVNGPPGTGKTTMLLSVVACLWVKNAIKKAEPPVIIASSTNNQAVTNIIDSFAKDFSKGNGVFAGRWIDEVNSFGSYFVASTRADDAKKKGYITEEVINEMETEDFYIRAKQSFLEKSRTAFQNENITVKQSVQELHKLLMENENLLKDVEEKYKSYHKFGKCFSNYFRVNYKDKEAVTKLGKTLSVNLNEIEAIENNWEEHLASESLFLLALSFIPSIRKSRNLKAKVFAKKHNFLKHLEIKNLDVESFIVDIENKKKAIIADIHKYAPFKKELDDYTDLLNRLEPDTDPNLDFIEIDKKADTKIRFDMFLIATHYWEGRWLLEMEYLIEKKYLGNTGWKCKNIRKDNWHRRMKITPCAVMTSYMMPNHFSYSRKIHENPYKVDYLYDFIDLLIVDEAGQVSPDVAGAGFSLAKKALVIGDTKQIAPISNLIKSIDIGNLHKVDLISRDQKLNEIDKAYIKLQLKGIASDGGSVMKIAQNRTKYYPEKKLERGLYLYEHWRCFNSIIAFCNELCYKGVLKPMRGEAAKDAFLPPMGYLNIEGKCEQASSSNVNKLEAKIIAEWIITNYKELREAYGGKEIKDIVAVVTPFKVQSRTIADYLEKHKDKSIAKELSQITVGTVHSLQGAEKKVILFSPTYSVHCNGNFIDKDKSMLNVAVSRAKDSFLVFGDMSIFNRQSVSPSGILAKYLFADERNKLSYEPLPDFFMTEEKKDRLFPNRQNV